jgi:ABC-type dipeptide/oligopeptide/nickel transport system permease component
LLKRDGVTRGGDPAAQMFVSSVIRNCPLCVMKNCPTHGAAGIREPLGLNLTVVVQFGFSAWNVVRGNFSSSLYPGPTVMYSIGNRLVRLRQLSHS